MPRARSRLALGTASPWHSSWGFVHQPRTSAGRARFAGEGVGQFSEPEQAPSPPAHGLAPSKGPCSGVPAFSSWLQAPIFTFFRGLLLFCSGVIHPSIHMILAELLLHARPLLDAGDPVLTRYPVPVLFRVHSLGDMRQETGKTHT